MLKVNGVWLWLSLMEMVVVGVMLKGGVWCLVFMEEDVVGCVLFVCWCEDVGMMFSIDCVGNLFVCCVGKLV